MSMDAIKRASFASKQLPAGPAPLASFEDLPSDELESPEDSCISKPSSSLTKSENWEETTSNCTTLISTNTPDTLPISNLSTPQVESDFDSHCTLTPVECNKIQSASEFRTSSLSSLPKDDDVSLTKQKKGSVVSLGTYEMSETEYNQRKSSWTDIFRSHNQTSKISSDQAVNLENKSKHSSKKKHKSETAKNDSSDIKYKERGKFLGIFKPGKKSNKNIDAVPETLKNNSDAKNTIQSFEDVPCEKSDTRASEEKENEQPKQIELLPVQFQNDLDKSSTISTDSHKLPIGSKENDMRNNLNIAEKEYNIFSVQSEEVCEKAINKEKSDEKEAQNGHESSESELTFDVRDQVLVKKEDEDDDFEKENLLAQDSSEIEDDPSMELNPVPVFAVPQPASKISRQQRLEVTTVPIDRPRSTTPINIAPLEAFIRSASPSFDPKVEKIKLTLPGEQFLGRMKSPKRSTTKSWADFCEEGLHSPRMQKKGDEFNLPQDVFESKIMQWDNFKGSDKEWVTFETKTERKDTPDLFRDLPIEETVFDEKCETSSAIELVTNLKKCSCECHSQGCENSYIKANEHFPSAGSIKVDVFSDKCQCQCHERYVHLWSPTDTTSGDLLSEICDTLKSSEFASDFAPSLASGQF